MNIEEYKALQKPAKKRDQREFKLHVEVVKHIRSAFPKVLFTHAGKGKSPKHGEDLKRLGYRKGTPDLLLWWASNTTDGIKAGAIELKAPDGNTSKEQDTFDYLFTRIGGFSACCKSKAEVHWHMVAWGLIPLHGPGIEPNYLTKEQKFKLAYDMFAPDRKK